MRFFTLTLGNMAGIWLATLIVSGVAFERSENGWITLLQLFLIALILTLVNYLVRPIVKTLTFPLYIITFGLFALVTNGLMFLLAGWLATQVQLPLTIDGWWPAFWAGTVTAIVAAVVAGILRIVLPDPPQRRT